MNYYNEYDKKAAAWLRELIREGHVAPGVVDERSILDVRPGDLTGFTQLHFFAGIGVWSYALRRAGWPDSRPVWTGSCPCQPFSNAGQRLGVADERHLWPHWFQLIVQCRPADVLGEQVASKDGLGWLDSVHADLEAAGYSVGAADLCAAGVGAPHIRQRLFFAAKSLAHPDGAGPLDGQHAQNGRGPAATAERGGHSSLADTQRPGLQVRADRDVCGTVGHDEGRLAVESGDGGVRVVGHAPSGRRRVVGDALGQRSGGHVDGTDVAGVVGHTDHERLVAAPQPGLRTHAEPDAQPHGGTLRPGPTNGHWAAADWIFCRDGKWRPVEPGTFPLAHGAPERVGRLRGYGNAIVAQVAETFIAAYLDVERGLTL